MKQSIQQNSKDTIIKDTIIPVETATENRLEPLKIEFDSGQETLLTMMEILARKAHKLTLYGNLWRVAVILFGALSATETAAVTLRAPDWLFGVVVATAGGILAAFKYETRAAELKVIATTCQSSMETLKTKWHEVMCANDSQRQLDMALEALKAQDTLTTDALREAAKHTNITRKMIKEQRRKDKSES